MADLQSTIEQVTTLPRLRKRLILTEGQSIKDDAEVLAFSSKTVPAGKVANISVRISVTSLGEAE